MRAERVDIMDGVLLVDTGPRRWAGQKIGDWGARPRPHSALWRRSFLRRPCPYGTPQPRSRPDISTGSFGMHTAAEWPSSWTFIVLSMRRHLPPRLGPRNDLLLFPFASAKRLQPGAWLFALGSLDLLMQCCCISFDSVSGYPIVADVV
jgi:hypothetical protein